MAENLEQGRSTAGSGSPSEEKHHQKSFRELGCDDKEREDEEPMAAWEDKIGRLKSLLEENGLAELFDKHRQEEDPIRCLLRFLGACSGEVEDAMKMLRRDLQWREQMGILELRNKTINDVVGDAGAVEVIDELLPTKFLGRDFQGRPVLYRKLSPAWTAAKCCNQDMRFNISKFQEWQAWIMERMLDQLNRQGCCVCIVDVSGWSSTSMSMDFLTWGKALQKLVTEHYPQRVLHTYIINAPPAFSAAERIIKGWLKDPQRITVLGNMHSFVPVLSMLMDKDMFPLSCGGKAELNLHTCCLRTGEMCLERNVQLQGLDMLQGDMEALSLPHVTVVGALSVAASRRGSLIEAMSRRGSMTMKEDKSSDSDEAEKRTSVSPQRDRGAGRWSPCDDEAHRRGDDSDLRDWGRGGRPRPESDFEPAEEWRAAAGRGGVGWAHGDVDVEEQENDETEESTGPGYPLRRLGSNTEDQSRSGVT